MNEEEKKKLFNELDEIASEKIEQLKSNYLKIRDEYQNTYDWPEIDPIRYEVSLCIMFGLNQAAITLTNHLLENLLKTALIAYYSKDNYPANPNNKTEGLIEMTQDARDKYSDMDLGDCINAVRRAGLIDKKQQKALHEIREGYRNAFSHADKEKIFQEGTVPIQVMNVDDNGISVEEKKTVKIKDLVIGQGIIQAMQAEREAVDYFKKIDYLARKLFDKIFNDSGNS